MRILVTGVLGPAGRSLARQLVALGHSVVGCDMQGGDLEGIELHIVPPAVDPGMLPALVRLARSESVDVVVPTVSEELLSVAAARAAFPVPVLISPVEGVAVAADKLYTMWALERAGVAIPRYAAPSDLRSEAAAFERLGAPLIAKPRVSRGGRGVRVVEPGQELLAAGDADILQEFAPGTEYAPVVWVCENADEDFVAVLRKTELKEGRVGNAVSVVRDDGDATADVAELALRTARALGLRGPVDMDIRRLGDGRPVVLEVNARFGANSAAVPELVARLVG